jgi:thiamine-phosphate pyrophosphorylase
MVRLASLNAVLIVNDRVEVAREVGAPGLHIGQGDGDPGHVRSRIGPNTILGLSIETTEQVMRIPEGVDYLGVGPIHATASKPDHAAPIGIGGFAEIVALASLPCLAIGGVTARDAPELKSAGGAGMAIVSAISRAPDMERAARTLLETWSRA